jgi:serine/threonine-protein phosphatase 2A regulatory subunit A
MTSNAGAAPDNNNNNNTMGIVLDQQQQPPSQPSSHLSTPSSSSSHFTHAPIAGPLASGTTPALTLARCLTCDPESILTMPPFDLFVAQISSDSTEARVDAMKKLSIVGEAMGMEDTLKKLIPYLMENIVVNHQNSSAGSAGHRQGGGGGGSSTSSSISGGGYHENKEDEDDDDEILLNLATQLGHMVPGLIPGHAALPLLPILEHLCSTEETVVRDKAVETMNQIIPLLVLPGGGGGGGNTNEEGGGGGGGASSSSPFGLLLAMAKRLAGADWFTSKVSAAGILPTIYAFWNAHGSSGNSSRTNGNISISSSSDMEAKRELRILYKDLSEDDTPMVRRSAAKHFGRMVEAVAGLTESAESMIRGGKPTPFQTEENKRLVSYELVSIFQALSSDEQDSVRLLAVCCAGSVGCALGREPSVTSEIVLPVVRGGCADLSW